MTTPPRANGYEEIAATYMAARSNRGEEVVRTWARSLPRGAAVLDLGCGHGVPISQALIAEQLSVHGIDASPTLLEAFRRRFPNAVAECSTIEESEFFHGTFDAVVAWGLLFLLPPGSQEMLVGKVARALVPGGEFLFTAPQQACEWPDALTGLKSISLGAEAYGRLLTAAGLALIAQGKDDGDNHYYLAAKPTALGHRAHGGSAEFTSAFARGSGATGSNPPRQFAQEETEAIDRLRPGQGRAQTTNRPRPFEQRGNEGNEGRTKRRFLGAALRRDALVAGSGSDPKRRASRAAWFEICIRRGRSRRVAASVNEPRFGSV